MEKIAKPRTFFSDYNMIESGLFIGNEEMARDKESLKMINITHILVAGQELQVCYPNDFKYMKLDIIDSISENITKHFEQASEFIKEGIQTGGVLVHCKYGISRSSTLVIAYIMLNKKIPMQQAFNQVRHKRSAIQPNTQFMRQLRQYEKKIVKKC